jgi:hypothetical protein
MGWSFFGREGGMAGGEVSCHDPDFSRFKISSCIHGILHFKAFSKVLNLILQRILFQMAFTPILETKGISERKYFKMSSIVMELSYIFPFSKFL